MGSLAVGISDWSIFQMLSYVVLISRDGCCLARESETASGGLYKPWLGQLQRSPLGLRSCRGLNTCPAYVCECRTLVESEFEASSLIRLYAGRFYRHTGLTQPVPYISITMHSQSHVMAFPNFQIWPERQVSFTYKLTFTAVIIRGFLTCLSCRVVLIYFRWTAEGVRR